MFASKFQSSAVTSFCKLIINKNCIRNEIKQLRRVHSRKLNEKIYYDDIINLNVYGEKLRFPFVWLRENCQCDQCFHKTAQSRIIDWSDLNLNVQPINVEEQENSVKICWDDGHTSQYQLDWLKFRSFRAKDQKKYAEYYRPEKISWAGNQFKDIFKKYDYHELLVSDEKLYDCLYNLSVYGVVLVDNTPDSETASEPLINKIGFIRRTHYGDKYIVQQVVDTNNVAYLTKNLQMHTDLPYYDYCPGVNVLHCRVQTATKGGENLLSDCLFVANYMKKHHPNEYKLLTNLEVEWSDIGVEEGNEFYKLHRSPVICLDHKGDIIRTKLSIPQRGSHFLGNVEDVKPWYEAHALFLDLSHKFAADFRTDAGKTLIFDNSRLLHGRKPYTDTEKNVRRVIGAFMDWDEIYSRLRCLKVKLEGNTPSN